MGEVVRYDKGPTAWGERWIAVLRREPDGDLWGVWLSHKVLVDLFRRMKPRPGERIGVKRLADKPAENGKPGYAKYTLVVDRDDAEAGPDWENVEDPGDAAPEGEELGF
ncbi:MAG: hypothetical protein ABIH26_16070 [Candidatus Eisenbacteria bacterium]